MTSKTAQTLRRLADGRETMRAFVAFCTILRTEDGKPLRVHPFQRLFLAAYFAGATQVVVIIPKKNGKTTIMAALALFHLLVVAEAECVIAASSMEQATILYRQAVKLIRRSGLSTDVGGPFKAQEGYRRITYQGGQIRVLPGDAKTADGVIPTLALVDELHRHKSPELYAVLRDGLVARDGRMVTISTAGWDLDSPLGKIRRHAHSLETFVRKGTLNRASAPGFEFFEWALADGDDLHDLRKVKRANPAPWHTVTKLREQRDSPTMTPAAWSRFYCGVWTHGEEPWLQADAWDRMRVDVGGLADGDVVQAAIVYGHGAAVVLAGMREDGKVGVKAKIMPDPDVSLGLLERAVSDLAQVYRIGTVAHDTALTRSAELLEEQGVPTMEFPLRPQRMAIATASLRRVIDEGNLIHDGDPLLRQHVLSGATKDSEAGWRLVRTTESNALIALAVAVHNATEAPADRPMFVAL